MRRVAKWLGIGVAALGGVVAVLVVLAAGAAWYVLETSLPDYGGTVELPGLAGEVTVIRDRHAVPHIFAATLEDGYRALGYVHAQDRFFQMDFMRRLAAGRLAEMIGPPGLRSDRFMRTLGIYPLAEAAVAAMGAGDPRGDRGLHRGRQWLA